MSWNRNVRLARRSWLASFVSSLASLWFCFLLPHSFSADNPRPDDRIKISAGYPKLRINLAQFVAKEKGFFEKHGLDVEMQPFETAQPMMLAQIAGRLDVAGYCALSISFPAAQSANNPFLFGTLMLDDRAHPFCQLVVRKDATAHTIADLGGKTVGILPTVAFREMLKAILQKNALPVDSVKIQNVNVAMQTAALQSGAVDALFTTDPAATTAIAQGIARLLDPANPSPCAAYLMDPYPFGSATVTKDFQRKNPETVRRYFAALDDAIEFIRQHPEEAKQCMKPYIAEEMRPFVEGQPDTKYLKTNEVSAELFQKAADEYHRWGLLETRYDVSPHLYEGRMRE